jgi:hypothetical protein
MLIIINHKLNSNVLNIYSNNRISNLFFSVKAMRKKL